MATSRDSAEQMMAGIEQLRAAPLNEEERATIYLWNKGRALSQLVNLYGWEVVLEMLQGYVEGALKDLARIDPKEHDEVRAQHAVVFAANKIYSNFVEDVRVAIEASRTMPEVLKREIREPVVSA